ncbi:enoyl-CoA hydratase/isomerase family protein [Sinosporangium siamense]|uniref:Crotonase n=1 Tax=Sinosporangium siamense TaxID=1367973 RepID=A0A919RP20_9ACTN|nr:enoyl-CoA hydratase/isomerase family protein [Sinosporangium siamense]GII95544.1 crotonase [Sinosporangium siamense]
MSDALDVTVDDGIALIRLTAQPLGVLNTSAKEAFRELIAGLALDTRLRAAIVTGTGTAFSVGSDIREFRQERDWLSSAAHLEQDLWTAIEEAPFPTIAACNGTTLGGGAELAIACDIRIAAESARFGFPEVAVGTFASAGGTQRLPQHVGAGNAKRLLLTGEIITAHEALRIGLVQAVVPDADLQSQARTLAHDLTLRSPTALAATKNAVNTGLRHGRNDGHAAEDRLSVDVGLTDDAAEGQRAFREKRQARFGPRMARWVSGR